LTGIVKHLYTDIGKHVTKGQIIAELDLPDVVANLAAAQANLRDSQVKYAQQVSGVSMERVQTAATINQARATEMHSIASLKQSQADLSQQEQQTPADINKAETGLSSAEADMQTAQANKQQADANASSQIATANEQLAQAQANATNSSIQLKRQQALLAQGFVAASVVDAARATDAVNQSQVASAQQNIRIVKQNVNAGVQQAADALTSAQQAVRAARASLAAAKAETYAVTSKQMAVRQAQAQLVQDTAALRSAQAGIANDTLKMQDVAQAQDAAAQAAAQVSYNQAQVAKTIVRTPISGTVLQLAAQQGETLAAGLSAPTLIIVADLSRLQIDVFVDETDIGSVRLGQRADVTVDAFPNMVFHGTVTKVASGSTIQQGVITYDVAIAITGYVGLLKPDMTATATIMTGRKSNVVVVPSEAVKVGTRGSSVSVLKMVNGVPEQTTVHVKTGASDGVNTEILSGVNEGDTIVLASGASSLTGGRRGPASPFGPAPKKTPAKKKGG
ncbi:MAG: efflux RND transporter periplasmic adaptor subunit, partial [Armatimonadetes bacterium]|nr:efflux RND transporter periplasmic adaptor subunit [Armatimonadota bacterium]